jgi:4-hydroxy-tetrahydrodipicolinate synthase
MTSSFPRHGVIVALALPTSRQGRVLKRALATHLAWLREKGVHGVLALGSTGEFVRLAPDERMAALELIAELAAPLPVIANVSDINPRVAAGLGRFARRLGLPGVAIMPPHFYPVSAADQLAYFLHVAEAAGLPVMLYNFPELAGNRIAIETVEAFAKRAELAAIKHSGGEFSYLEPLVALGRKRNYSVFSGSDTRLEEAFRIGASGCIGGFVNFVPEYMIEIYRCIRDGAAGDLSLAVERMREVGRVMEKTTFPLNIAAGMEARGFDAGQPKTVISAETQRARTAIARELKAMFKSWKLAPASLATKKLHPK